MGRLSGPVALFLSALAGCALAHAAHAAPIPDSGLVGAAFAGADRIAPIQAVYALSVAETPLPGRVDALHVDTVRLASADPVERARLSRLDPSASERLDGLEVALVRNWPAAFSVDRGRLRFEVTPHAGFGVSVLGQSAEAGALLKLQREVLRAVGAGRVYLFAGASGRAVGLNLLRNPDPERLVVRDDGFVRSAQAGLGFDHARLHAALGFTQERLTQRSLGEANRVDNRIGLRLSVR